MNRPIIVLLCGILCVSCSANRDITFVLDHSFLFSLPSRVEESIEKQADIVVMEAQQSRFTHTQVWKIFTSDALIVLPSLLSSLEELVDFFRPPELPEIWLMPFGQDAQSSESLPTQYIQFDRREAFAEAGATLAEWISETGNVAIFLLDQEEERKEGNAFFTAFEEKKTDQQTVREFYYSASDTVEDVLRKDLRGLEAEAYVFVVGAVLPEMLSILSGLSGKLVIEALFPEFVETFSADAVIAFEIDDLINAVKEKGIESTHVPAQFLRYSSE